MLCLLALETVVCILHAMHHCALAAKNAVIGNNCSCQTFIPSQ